MKVSDNFACEECRAILRELSEAARADREKLLWSDRDLTVLRKEWLSADEFQIWELAQAQYPKSIAARRRWREHEILTGHSVALHGWRAGLPGAR